MLCTSPLSSSINFPAITINSNGGKTRLKSIKFNFTTKMSLEPSSSSNPNLINSITKLLWGKSLPPQLLISTVRSTWNTVWLLMMSQLAPSDPSGSYTRPTSQFRVNPNGNSNSISNALHLYVGLPCPWAHRTLIVRALKGLENDVPVSIASPGIDGAWVFLDSGDKYEGCGGLVPGLDNVNGRKTLKEVYRLRRDGYNGRATVPMLWDLVKKDVVCNESYDILELFNSGLNGLSSNPDLDLSPPALKERIDEWNHIIYPKVNNGVYRCGFAQSQEAYDIAANELFSTFDMIDDHLGSSRYLCGDTLTLSDICLFTTLIRFDLVYNVMFKCTKKKIIEYPNLHGYLRDIYQVLECYPPLVVSYNSLNMHLLILRLNFVTRKKVCLSLCCKHKLATIVLAAHVQSNNSQNINFIKCIYLLIFELFLGFPWGELDCLTNPQSCAQPLPT